MPAVIRRSSNDLIDILTFICVFVATLLFAKAILIIFRNWNLRLLGDIMCWMFIFLVMSILGAKEAKPTTRTEPVNNPILRASGWLFRRHTLFNSRHMSDAELKRAKRRDRLKHHLVLHQSKSKDELKRSKRRDRLKHHGASRLQKMDHAVFSLFQGFGYVLSSLFLTPIATAFAVKRHHDHYHPAITNGSAFMFAAMWTMICIHG